MARSLLFAIAVFAVAVAATFHASGAVSALDARMAMAVDGSLGTSPPHPVSSRILALGADLVRLVWAPTGLFRAIHLAAGLLLAGAAVVAARLAARSCGAPVAAALLVGAALPLGGDTGGLGLTAHPVPVLLLLLSGAALAWSADSPRPRLGGLLLGLALADDAFVLFVLPGFGAFALLATLRMSPARGGQFLRHCALGVLLGFLAVLLPWLAPGDGVSHAAQARGPLDALAGWAGGAQGAVWAPGGPQRWIDGVRAVGGALWRNTGPLGIALGIAGIAAFLSGAARRARPFLVVHAIVAAAVVLGTPRAPGTAAALLGWSFLFWSVPALSRIASRAGGAAPAVAAATVVALFAVSHDRLDRSAEKGVTWTSTVLETLPADAVLFTANPVALALAADGLRSDVEVIDVGDATTLSAVRSGRPLLPLGATQPRGAVDAALLRQVVAETGGRPVFVDASVFFDTERKASLLGEEWKLLPHGLAFRLAPLNAEMSVRQRDAAALAWADLPITPDTPPSPLRDGLGGSAYFARSLVQSAYLHLEQERVQDAEREFLLALGHPASNRNLAAMGLARLLFDQRNFHEVVRTLDVCVRDDEEGAWVARRLQGNTLVRLGDRARGIAMLKRALALTPAANAEDRQRLQRTIRDLERATPPSGAGSG